MNDFYDELFKYTGLYACMYGTVYGSLYLINRFKPDWFTSFKISDHEFRKSHASQFASMYHAVSSLAISGYSLYVNPTYTITNTPLQQMFMLNTCGYFFYDQINMLLGDFETLFTFHHVLAGCYLASSYLIDTGGYYAAWALFWGEITNPVMIIWSFARKNRLMNFYKKLSPFFTYYFTIVRCLILPLASMVTCYYMYHDPMLSRKIKMFWISNAFALNGAGIIWSYLLCRGYMKLQAKQRVGTKI